jgi:hypothetical protein
MSALARFVVTPLLFLSVAALGVGCESCKKGAGVTQALLDKPPKEDVEKQVTEALRNAAAIASELCGFPAGGLTEVQVEVKSQLLGGSEVHVTGKPLPFDAGVEDPMFDAGIKRRDAGAGARDGGAKGPGARDGGAKDAGIDIPRALVCAGIVAVTMNAELSDDLQGRKNWHLVGDEPIEVKGIETAGVVFDAERHRAKSSSHHHHHHH